MQYTLGFATVIKCIAHTTFNYIMYKKKLFFTGSGKNTMSYILFLAGTSIKSKMLYIIYIEEFIMVLQHLTRDDNFSVSVRIV